MKIEDIIEMVKDFQRLARCIPSGGAKAAMA